MISCWWQQFWFWFELNCGGGGGEVADYVNIGLAWVGDLPPEDYYRVKETSLEAFVYALLVDQV